MAAFSYYHNQEQAFSHEFPEEMSSASSSFVCCLPSAGGRSRSGSISNSNGSSMERKRFRGGPALSPVQSKEARRRKQKKVEVEKEQPKEGEENPVGYIHVRARRGQATDSHSLAERVRREKISERMKMLQGLVPGCDKVVGKALMLDEIINYVQSLQNQVEFLSMKLACVNPMLNDLGLDYDCLLVNRAEDSQVLHSLLQASLIHPTHLEQNRARACQAMVEPASFLLHDQANTPLPQENGNFLMQVVDQRHGTVNQLMHSMSSFQ
ncbi:hypothetical protein HPP92_025015 [Vanilla planifolia]|uniref:BHLH domain-containing protein n=1 Tax=Vanilla planifolia TaxID=51239 RepID=A0A835PH36_VANPL|nr:hypothetical protein HPP92_025015 [Vanilla planifolia]